MSQYARAHVFPMKSDGKITVVAKIHTTANSDRIRRTIRDRSGRIIAEYRQYVEFEIPIEELRSFEGDIDIQRIAQPFHPYPHAITGEEVSLTKANRAQMNGYNGQGIKVAIIDGGFINNAQAIAAGELPENIISYDFSGNGLDTDSIHGTAVAEVVHDMAPYAQLYLLKIRTAVQLGQAKDYCKRNGINIINHSMGWFGYGWGDGKGLICDIANDAYNNGILWVNSAGNNALSHWQGDYSDPNADSFNEFSASANINRVGVCESGSTLTVFLTWNDPWGASSNDYDLFLVRWTGSSWAFQAASEYTQNGNDDPVEAFGVDIATTADYGIVIKKHSGAARSLQLFCYENAFKYAKAEQSISQPADATGVLAVGAIAFSNWPAGAIEIFSSQGPTQDNRKKPDICGVDFITNYIYGDFPGTSCAAPCVAGAAAVIWSAYQNCIAKDVWNSLQHSAIDAGAAGFDNQYGAGAVDVVIVRRLSAINNAYRGTGDVIFDMVPKGGVVSIFTVSGKYVTSLAAMDDSYRIIWNVCNSSGPVAPGMYYCIIKEPGGKTTTTRLMITRSRYSQ